MERSTNRSVATRLRALLITLGLVLVGMVGVAGPASASAPVLLSGSAWLDGEGVNVCDGSTDPSCGGETHVGGWSANWWQCVELAQRLYKDRGWYTANGGIFAGVDYAYQIYDQVAANGMTRQANGSIASIVPGDMIIHGADEPYSGGAGHVSIVDHITGSTVYAVSQNTYNDQPVGTYALSSGTLSKSGSGTIRGVVHDPNNTNTNGGGAPSARAAIKNGGFNEGTGYWTRTGTANIAAYSSGQYEGSGYGATNAASSGDSIRQDVALNSTAGHSYCVSAMVRSNISGSTTAGSLAIYVLGSTATEGSSKPFSGVTNDWTPVESCVTATSSHTSLRVQIYPSVGAPTIGVDVVDMHESLLNSAGFNGSSSGWSRTGTANFALYGSGQYEGTGYAASNATASGDSIRQDVARTINSGDTYCVDARIRSNESGSTTAGSLAIWLLGSTATENSTFQYSNINTDWNPIKTCVTASGAHTSVRVQFYPAPGAPTVGIDAVALHPTLARNGGFNNSTWLWSATGTANFTTYGPSGTYEGGGFAATNAASSGDSIRPTQDSARNIDAGDMYCVSARVRTMGGGSGGSGSMALWMLGTSATENSVIQFSGLTGDWTLIKTCATATGDHTFLRVQIYPTVGAPTIGVDAVDMG